MEVRLRAWFLFILCVQALVSSVPESLLGQEHEVAEASKPVSLEQGVHGINGTIGTYGEGERGVSEDHHEFFHTGRAQGGKGAHGGGGGNIDRRPDSHEKNDASSIAKSSSLILNSMLHVIMALILVIPIFCVFKTP